MKKIRKDTKMKRTKEKRLKKKSCGKESWQIIWMKKNHNSKEEDLEEED